MKLITNYPKLSILFVVTVVYSSFLSGIPTVNPDAQIIIKNLQSWNNLFDYLGALFSLKTIDFQPVRDMTFFIDMFFFQNFKINTFVIQNLIWWVLSCFTIFEILQKLFPQKNKELILFLVMCFSVYPLFTYVVSWGVARKHIMAFFFILLSMNTILKNETLNFKTTFKVCVYYFLSVFSQPITILFPVWFFYYLLFLRKTPFKEIRLFISFTVLLQIFFLIINYYYYTSSNVFLFHYAPKTNNLFEIGDKVLALGHYYFQIFCPYLLSFNYGLGDITVIIGMGFLISYCLIIYKSNSLNNFKIFFIIPSILTFVIILSTPHHLYDTYLLFPAFSVLCFIVFLLSKIDFHKIKIFYFFLLILGGCYSHIQTRNWLSNVSLAKSSFNRRPSCKNALNYTRMSYEAYLSPSAEVKQYLTTYECLKNLRVTKYDEITHSIFLSYILFHENFFSLNEKIIKLDDLAQKTIFARFAKSALLIQNERFVDADKELAIIVEKLNGENISPNQYHPLTANIIHPYCIKRQRVECLKITSKLINANSTPYL